ncbi:pyrroline-5-carboxylate reductase [Talaromyces islandicus]|uniref:Pyrroline-5-carboxylate reductase n=1 Tax=Talaromyces islandicus TaxID=28573 RepID=A0A0U1M8P8_TALIS|nr:pyrroline-5-carboxylate reductase [Talaromyces islandicus]
MKSVFYKQFCAGETHNEVKSTIRQFKDMGFQGTIMTYAKETVFDHRTREQQGLGITKDAEQDVSGGTFCPHIEAWRKGTVETVELLGKSDYLAVKLTGAGPTVTGAFAAKELPPSQMLEALDEISLKCKERGVRILVDAESQHFQWGILRLTLELMKKYNRDGYAMIYNTYQAYLKSTPDTLAKHLAVADEDGFTLGLKLALQSLVKQKHQRYHLHPLFGSSPELEYIALWGNLGSAILQSLLTAPEGTVPFSRYIACVQSNCSEKRLAKAFSHHQDKVTVAVGDNVEAVNEAGVIILALDPSVIGNVLKQPGISAASANKLVISVAAGWTRSQIETTLYSDVGIEGHACVIRTLPNIAALVSQSLTAIEIEPGREIPKGYLQLTDAIFSRVGRTVHVPPNLMNATTAVAGSTPAMFSVIVDAMIDAAVAVGVPRNLAHTMIFQAMQGTATMLQSGISPAQLKDQGTSPEGCTIGGLMIMEEAGVRGHVGRALREAVTIARLMDGTRHVNDTRE